ncbi:hypothetical protein [Streptacidiphilus sp. P02-A3a]|uniref:hypothetical protein n=1 Tax=Streptacidiphilus sp. P02-A3a TaxID=2704468 RepID=UPI0015FCFAAE|nr:hypothetical protein [Streptacidiphilus sp. P02-A3a]QMU71756.1 hypothetical protein GXP74_29420 [Streptacidiphilus sp. P02-A3a]
MTDQQPQPQEPSTPQGPSQKSWQQSPQQWPQQSSQQWQQAGGGSQGPPQKQPRNKWKIGCLGCGGLVVLIGIIVTVVVATSVSHEASKKVTITYQVTGTANGVTISYSNWQDNNWSTSQSTVATLPWNKEITSSGLVKGGELTVSTGATGGTVNCSVTVGNGSPKTATASGAYAIASCSGFGS